MSPALLVVVILAGASPTTPSPSPTATRVPTREDLQAVDQVDDAIRTLKAYDAEMEAITEKRWTSCMKAFGHKTFCACLRDEAGAGLSFDEYVLATTRSDEELGYKSLERTERGMIDNARDVREKCVRK